MIKILLSLIIFLITNEVVFAKTDDVIVTIGSSFLNILNLIWLPLVILAGKLFTNDFVYGTFMYMDAVLWKTWNFSKNVSLIILGLVLVYSIFGLFVGKTKNIGQILLKVVIAGILIPVSWFIIGVLLDISTLLLVAVGGLPMKLVSSLDVPKAKIKYCQDIYLNPTLDFTQVKDIADCKKKGGNINDFISKMNNLAGPLLYIGQSILYLDRNWGILDKQQLGQEKQDPLKTISIGVLLKLVVLILFIAPVFSLVLIGLIRIFWLWIYIGFTPFIILDQVFGGKVLGKKEYFKFSNMIGLIFQPVFVVFAMGLSLVFLSNLRNVMVVDHTSGKVSPGLVQLGVCEGKPNSFCLGNTPVFKVSGNLMKDFLDDVGGFFGYLIFVLLVAMILFSSLKVASKSSSLTSSTVDSVYKFANQSFMAIPIIPTSRGPVSLGGMKMVLNKKDILTKGLSSKTAENADKLIRSIYKKVGIDYSDLGMSDMLKWESEINSIKDSGTLIRKFKIFIIKTLQNNKEMIIASSPNFKKVVYAFLNKALVVDSTAKAEFAKMGILDKDKKHLLPPDKVFNNDKFLTFLYNVFKKGSDLYEVPNFSGFVSPLPKTGDPNFIYKKLGDVFKK